MNAAQFQTWVKQGPTASDVPALRALVARYPYSGILRLWLAKASFMAEDLNRNEDLLAAGAHIPSRRALFQALMGPALVEAAQHIHQEVLAAPEVSEEELVKLVWHDVDAAPEPAADIAAEPVLEDEEAPEELEGMPAMPWWPPSRPRWSTKCPSGPRRRRGKCQRAFPCPR